ncbi:hypothetical protein ACFLU5_14170, partial [Bacteroidota bacterium]
MIRILLYTLILYNLAGYIKAHSQVTGSNLWEANEQRRIDSLRRVREQEYYQQSIDRLNTLKIVQNKDSVKS